MMMMMMSEKEREIEREEESLDHFIHEHPLTLQIQSNDKGDSWCEGCMRFFWDEAAYACKTCNNEIIIHEECAKMPREMIHPLHPQHTLLQKEGDPSQSATCAVCEERMFGIGYLCSSTCDFQLHLVCTPAAGVKRVSDQQTSINHPSHPEHQLTLLRKRLSFNCDACGAMETGRPYVCVACQFLIHEHCAALPSTKEFHHHRHPLSLAFYLPPEYVKYLYKCDVCGKDFLLNRWVYHCQSCTYAVHINCAFTASAPASLSDTDVEGVVKQFPIINKVDEELIKSFVIKERGDQVLSLPHDHNNQKFLFPVHPHQLTLVTSEIHDEQDEDEDEDSGSGGEERLISWDDELVCDACIMPIFPKKKHDYQSDYYKYMSCDECKYFLHWECFHLPRQLPNHPLHPKHNKFKLEGCGKLDFWERCNVCWLRSNGLFYKCTECKFKVDVKCASLPNTIKHAAHPQHHLHLNLVALTEEKGHHKSTIQCFCVCCQGFISNRMLYKCSNCAFSVCVSCAFFPATNKHESDKHPLPLRYDAKLDRRGPFYCDECETQIYHKKWMYRCDDCDTSFHPDCFNTTSGRYRNIKFGQRYGVSADTHPHPLTYQPLTTKLYCDVCRSRVYRETYQDDEDGRTYQVDQRGFHCFSCNFFMCLATCEDKVRWAIDDETDSKTECSM